MSAYGCCGEYNDHSPNCIIIKYRELQNEFETLKKENEELIEAFKFAAHAMEYAYTPDLVLPKDLSPLLYHTGTYEGDLMLRERAGQVRKCLQRYTIK
jgi:hypothetical protein